MLLRRVLLIGDHRHGEFRSATAWLGDHSHLSIAANPDSALAAVQPPALPPELIVVAQTRPSQFGQTQIEAIHRLAPLARLVMLAGSWCEGELRTGHPWPGVLRIYWHQAQTQLQEMLTESTPLWNHPRTMTDVERLLAWQSPPVVGQRQLIAIGTESSITYHGLAGTCVHSGYAAVWVHPRHQSQFAGAAAGIWDEPQFSEPRSSQASRSLQDFRRQLDPRAPIVALVNFPRLSDYQRLQEQGVTQLLAKPFMNADLAGTLAAQLVCQASQSPRVRAVA